MRSIPIVLLVVLALVLPPATASAAEKPYLVHFGVGFSKALTDGAPGGSVGLQAGLIYRLQQTPQVGIGGEIGYMMLGSNTNTVYDGVISAEETAKWSTVPITGQIYYFVHPSMSTPFLTAGLGMYQFRLNYDASASGFGNSYAISADVSETDFGLNVGAGMLFGTSRNQIRFGADARLHMIMTEGDATNVIAILGRLYF